MIVKTAVWAEVVVRDEECKGDRLTRVYKEAMIRIENDQEFSIMHITETHETGKSLSLSAIQLMHLRPSHLLAYGNYWEGSGENAKCRRVSVNANF